MKGLAKIIRRYSLTAAGIILAVLLANFSLFLYLGYRNLSTQEHTKFIRTVMENICSSFLSETASPDSLQLSPSGFQLLKDSPFIWAMALDQEGDIAWSWQLPAGLHRSYSLQDAAAFSRWYLDDYPVRTWSHEGYLLVFGSPRDQFAKYSLELDQSGLQQIPRYLGLFFLLNLLMVALFVLLLGFRFYRSLCPVAEGIEQLSRQQPVRLRERGMIADLAKEINQTSLLLEQQSRKLQQRDQARTDWIAGVSHDIRTPLALIMGYSDSLAASPRLDDREKSQAEALCRQSVLIRQLIEDLNLTSKLTYHAQPLHREAFFPALLLRECVTEFYNDGLDENYEIEVFIPEEMEQIQLYADAGLWKRALRNLLGNSIRHNPTGCRIQVRLTQKKNRIWYEILDTGAGIPETIVTLLNHRSLSETVARPVPAHGPHIMGLHLAKQIALAHGGDLWFQKRESGTYDAILVLQ